MKLSTKLTSPTNSNLEMLRHVAKYLKGTLEITLVDRKSFLESFRNAQDDEGTERDPQRDNFTGGVSDSRKR